MSTTIPGTIKDPEAFLAEIEVDIPAETILPRKETPTVIAPITMVPIGAYGDPVQTTIEYNQTASTSQKETASSQTLKRSIQTNIQQETIGTHVEQGGDTISTVLVRPSLTFSISIPISLQPS